MHVLYHPATLFVLLLFSHSTSLVPGTSASVVDANHSADLEARSPPENLFERQQGTVTVYPPGYSPPTTTYALGPTLYSTLTPGQTEISLSASLSCQGDTCIGEADGQTTWTTSNPFAAPTSSSAAVIGSISSTTTRTEGTSEATQTPPSTASASTAANGSCPRLSMSILLCAVAVFASVVGITLS